MPALRFFSFVAACCVVAAPAHAVKTKVEEVYREHCASCHGAAMLGGSGGSLADGRWNHGSTDQAISQAIAEGIPDAGMPGFKRALSPEVIRSLVVYIREKESSNRPAARPVPAAASTVPVKTTHESYLLETMLDGGLETPWALAFLPEGRKLVTERGGRLKILDEAWKPLPEPVSGTPSVVPNGQGGLLDVVPAPDFDTSGWIYLTYSAPLPGDSPDTKTSMTKVTRGRLSGNAWVDGETVFEGDPDTHTTRGVHFGSRIVFDRGYLFFSIGDRGDAAKAQNLSVPNGKILRLHPDGRVPDDNPFAGRSDAHPAIWSYGHRNPQGLVVDPQTHEIYATEHGPRGGDEFNLIRNGANFGWPLVCFGMNYDGSPLTAKTEMEGIDAPLHHWTPSIATCGLAFYNGDKFPAWSRDFFVGGLKGGLHRLRLREGRVVEDEVVFDSSVGRVRDVRCGPDGLIYVVLNKPDRIIRLVPAGGVADSVK